MELPTPGGVGADRLTFVGPIGGLVLDCTPVASIAGKQPRHTRLYLGPAAGSPGVIKRELRRRSAIEAVIGHMKTDGHLGRCYLKGREGDATNAVLSAVGYNLRLVLAWLRLFCVSSGSRFYGPGRSGPAEI
jgi:hypothetical protein